MTTVLEATPNLSVINRIELLGWIPKDPNFAIDLKLFVATSQEFGLTEDIIEQTILIRKGVKIKLPDAIIAATAIANGLTLLSDNDTDFLRVPRLKYVNPARL
ncbi:PIN domain-containing protein [Spirosoma soli]|uniref:PIN domain-containing protein n=2 Tax=Spirosoma soli TaxID=1770529 RepID=A0ABW5MAK7_9BACT